jgi:hypothetical protein
MGRRPGRHRARLGSRAFGLLILALSILALAQIVTGWRLLT